MCEKNCPSGAIKKVEGEKKEGEKKKTLTTYILDFTTCSQCGICVEVCPEEAIVMSKDYELAFTNREEAIYGKDKLLIPVNKLQDRIDFLRQYK